MKNLDENKLYSEMNLEEQKEVNGGDPFGIMLAGIVVGMVIDYWPDIKQAAVDAWNGKQILI